jgi:acetyl esterase/lipase
MKISPRIFAVLILLLSSLGAIEQEDRFVVHKDLVYSEVNGGLTLDLFLPDEMTEKVPCILVIQGGGFRPQNGQKFRPFAEYLVQHGYMLLAVTGGMDTFEGKGDHSEYSSSIQAAVSFAGVFDFVARFTDEEHIALQPKVKTKVVSNGKWVGPAFSPDNNDWVQASAITHVDKDDPPMLFLQCKDDTTVPWLQSQEMYEAMKEVGVDVSLKYYEIGGQGFNKLGEQSLREIVKYFKEKL